MKSDQAGREQALASYRAALRTMQEELRKRRLLRWVPALEDWEGQLSAGMDDEDLCRHARRTMRSLGGMESIGEMASGLRDRALIELVEHLHNAAKRVAALRK